MTAVLLTVHVLIVLALIGIVLLQRSEGGALGIGGGGFMSGRGAASALTRTTTALGFLFFGTSLGLAMLADTGESEERIIRELTGAQDAGQEAPARAPASPEDLLRTLGAEPEEEAPAGAADEPAPSPEQLLESLGAPATGAGEPEAAGSAMKTEESATTEEETPPQDPDQN
ncbi:preprotein translocase subunit SecG [Amphiplicatus metriothermophilus]|uniref:Protein-export membrane protein SecG n=1 Tax=Amphiplicatus metriothermophilus TaxID=1519374 RepID=A0A239Q0W5_9PROT|nr:preprotein translocase subunit SecG [Amphiplicatus metriothermophilus]MBB5520059.1 preprotein translocase subunit SecG [Amphiplicatus metriothermophilus]SNT75842.1 protein translocase subunit secG [Amphiplicatus metriothermophilus]